MLASSLNPLIAFGSPANFIVDNRACRHGATNAAKCAAFSDINLRLLATGALSHLGPNEEMTHRHLGTVPRSARAISRVVCAVTIGWDVAEAWRLIRHCSAVTAAARTGRADLIVRADNSRSDQLFDEVS
jgi:hypothetical protein